MEVNEENGEHEGTFLASGVYLLIIGIAGAILNSMAFIYVRRAQKTKWNLLLINLLVSDLSIIFIGIPLEAIGAFSKGQAMNHVLCRITAFTHTLSGMSSLYTITVLAAVRFISTIQYDNSWYVVTREKWFTLRCVQLIWIFSLILAIPPTVGIGEYVKDIGMISCAPDWSTMDNFGVAYNWVLMTLGFFIPTTIVLVSNVTVFHVSRKYTQKRITIQRIAHETNRKTRYLYGSCPTLQRTQKRHRRLTLSITSITLSFYLTWTPYAMTSLLTMIGVWMPDHLPSVIAILLAKSSTLINPILYIYFNKDINHEKETKIEDAEE